MRLTKLNCVQYVDVNIFKYKIDWDKKSASGFQTSVKQFLRKYWEQHLVLEEFRIPGSLLRCDFLNINKRIALESDGSFHDTYSEFFHRGSKLNFLANIKRDAAKDKWLEKNGFKIVNVFEKDLPLSLEFFQKEFGVSII